ncbi:MAG: hypothetical protein HG459_000530 [Bacteroidia bacterium]|nr:hypothetical protein [Bacteroidia bacterium]
MRRIITTAVVAFCLAAFAWGAAAQEMKEAVDLYNGAATSFKQNPQQAVADLQKSIEICEALNSEESGKLANSARKLLPDAYFYLAQELYKKQKTKESFAAMETSKTSSEAIGDMKRANRATRTLSSLYFQQGRQMQLVKNYVEAIELCKKSLQQNDRVLDVWIVIAQCQDSLKRYDDMLQTLRDGMDAAQRAANLARKTDMQVLATNHLKAEAIKRQEAKDPKGAIAILTKALEFDAHDATIYQPLAVAYASLKEYEEVIKNVDLALECLRPGEDNTGLYFMKASAQQANGDTNGACESYKLAAFGTYKSAAEHEMKDVLKCK